MIVKIRDHDLLAKLGFMVVVLSPLFALLAIGTISLLYATSNTTNITTTTTVVEQEEQDRIITSNGCGEGYGYYVDDPNPICEPLDKIREGPPPDMAFCAALGCPYSPPNLDEPSPPLATTPVEPPGPGELSAAECAAIQCDPENPVQPEQEQDSEAEEENTDNDNNDSSGGQ